jgi:hypothetical protein
MARTPKARSNAQEGEAARLIPRTPEEAYKAIVDCLNYLEEYGEKPIPQQNSIMCETSNVFMRDGRWTFEVHLGITEKEA